MSSNQHRGQGFATPTIPAPPDGKPRSQRGFLLQAPLSALATSRGPALLTDVGQTDGVEEYFIGGDIADIDWAAENARLYLRRLGEDEAS